MVIELFAVVRPISTPVGVGLALSIAGLAGLLILLGLLLRRRHGDHVKLTVALALIFAASIAMRIGYYAGWW